MGVHRLTATDFRRRLDRGETLVVLDVRELDERAFCAIALPGGVMDLHVPMGEIQGRLDEVRRAAASLPLVVYCHHGVRSLAVGRWLADQGLADVHNLDGGIDAWSLEVDPSLPRY